MKCRKCDKEFDEADKALDYKRIVCSAGPVDLRRNWCSPQRLGSIGLGGVGEFAPLCVKCYYGAE